MLLRRVKLQEERMYFSSRRRLRLQLPLRMAELSRTQPHKYLITYANIHTDVHARNVFFAPRSRSHLFNEAGCLSLKRTA